MKNSVAKSASDPSKKASWNTTWLSAKTVFSCFATLVLGAIAGLAMLENSITAPGHRLASALFLIASLLMFALGLFLAYRKNPGRRSLPWLTKPWGVFITGIAVGMTYLLPLLVLVNVMRFKNVVLAFGIVGTTALLVWLYRSDRKAPGIVLGLGFAISYGIAIAYFTR